MYGRIWHYPWPDHHPPPFKLVPGIMASMRNWLRGEEGVSAGKRDGVQVAGLMGEVGKRGERVVVVHCKAGKGRSGSMAVSYLLSEEGWTREAALQRFTERRMRPGFGPGVSIPSQLRWLDYVERWSAGGKVYVERSVEVTEVHVWGLRDGVKLAIEGYVDEGKTIKTFHVFKKQERDDVSELDGTLERGTVEKPGSSIADVVTEMIRRKRTSKPASKNPSRDASPAPITGTKASSFPQPTMNGESPRTADMTASISAPEVDVSATKTNTIFRPASPVILPTSDINLSCERRARASVNWNMVTSVAHVWFNCFFEGNGPENMYPKALRRFGSDRVKRKSSQKSTASSSHSDAVGPFKKGPDSMTSSMSSAVGGASDYKAAASEIKHISKSSAKEKLRGLAPPSGKDIPASTGPDDSGVFHITWDAMDGLKGSSKKGARAFDRAAVVWRAVPDKRPSASPVPVAEDIPPSVFTQKEEGVPGTELTESPGEESKGHARRSSKNSVVIHEPHPHDEIKSGRPANWKGGEPVRDESGAGDELMARRLGAKTKHDEDREGDEAYSTPTQSPTGEGTPRILVHDDEKQEPELDADSDEDGTEGLNRGVIEPEGSLKDDQGRAGVPRRSPTPSGKRE